MRSRPPLVSSFFRNMKARRVKLPQYVFQLHYDIISVADVWWACRVIFSVFKSASNFLFASFPICKGYDCHPCIAERSATDDLKRLFRVG